MACSQRPSNCKDLCAQTRRWYGANSSAVTASLGRSHESEPLSVLQHYKLRTFASLLLMRLFRHVVELQKRTDRNVSVFFSHRLSYKLLFSSEDNYFWYCSAEKLNFTMSTSRKLNTAAGSQCYFIRLLTDVRLQWTSRLPCPVSTWYSWQKSFNW